MRTATLDLNSRGSFVDDLNSKPGIVICRDALLHRSDEIQPAFFDLERKNKLIFIFFRFFFIFFPSPGPVCFRPFFAGEDVLAGRGGVYQWAFETTMRPQQESGFASFKFIFIF